METQDTSPEFLFYTSVKLPFAVPLLLSLNNSGYETALFSPPFRFNILKISEVCLGSLLLQTGSFSFVRPLR